MPQESFSTDLHANRRVGLTKVGDAHIARLLPKNDFRPLFARAHRRTRSRGASYVSRLGNGASGRRSGCAERRARGRLCPDAHETIGRSVVKDGASRDHVCVHGARTDPCNESDELNESSNDRFWQAVRAGFCSRRTVTAGAPTERALRLTAPAETDASNDWRLDGWE